MSFLFGLWAASEQRARVAPSCNVSRPESRRSRVVWTTAAVMVGGASRARISHALSSAEAQTVIADEGRFGGGSSVAARGINSNAGIDKSTNPFTVAVN
ncbi:MAG: hypothetical protein DME22_11530 [Verrucomicrobia bacterium]|nr:MAG: hypothetical protein DME22_11530 [Verrucomicrobiota bacterium]